MDFFIPILDSDRHVYLQLCKESDLYNAQAIVIFESHDGGIPDTSTFTSTSPTNGCDCNDSNSSAVECYNGASHDLEAIHQKPKFRIHLSQTPARLKSNVISALRLAEKNELRSLAFPCIPYSGDKGVTMARSMLEAFVDFVQCYRPLSVQTIMAQDYDVLCYKTAAVERDNLYGDVTRGMFE